MGGIAAAQPALNDLSAFTCCNGMVQIQAKRDFARSFERRSYAQKEAFVQSFGGEEGVPGSLLCDEMRHWSKECMASTDERCEVFITKDDFLGSCNAYCQSQVRNESTLADSGVVD